MTSSMRLVVYGGQSLDMLLRRAGVEEDHYDEVIEGPGICALVQFSKSRVYCETVAYCGNCYFDFVLGLVA